MHHKNNYFIFELLKKNCSILILLKTLLKTELKKTIYYDRFNCFKHQL